MTKPGPGKFEGNESIEVAEYLYEWTDAVNEQFGSVTENGFWEGLHISFKEEYEDLPELKPAYIVREDDQGFFTYEEFETADAAESKYYADLAAYESHYASR